MSIRTKLSPPWITYVNKIRAMFGGDPTVHIEYKDAEKILLLRVDDAEKAEAIDMLLPEYVEYGNIELDILVVPPNGSVVIDEFEGTIKELYETAFKGNPAFAYVHTAEGILGFTAVYVVFKNKVVQFFNDNLADAHGVISTLYQDIAEDIFDEYTPAGVYYCTDVVDSVGMPLKQWP